MPFNMPIMPDKLALLLAGRPIPGEDQTAGAVPPIAPVSAAERQVSGEGGGGTPFAGVPRMSLAQPGAPTMPGAAMPPPVAPAPPPSDDPAITGQKPPGVPPPPQFTTPDLGRLRSLQSQVATASKPVDYEANKPHWWDRLLGFGIGTAAGYGNPQLAGPAADAVTFRKFHGAEAERKRNLDPLLLQLQQEEKMQPIYNAANESQYRQHEAGIASAREQREQTAFSNEFGDKTSEEVGPDGKTHYYQYTKSGLKREVPPPPQVLTDKRRQEEDANTPAPGARPEKRLDPTTKKATLQVRTKSGAYMPWAPTTVEQGAVAGDPRSTELFNREHPGAQTKPPTRGQFNQVNFRKADAEGKADREYKKAVGLLTKPTGANATPETLASYQQQIQNAQDNKTEAYRAAQAAFESEITTLGGEPEHFSYDENGVAHKVGTAGNAVGTPPIASQPGAGQPKTVSSEVVRKFAQEHKIPYEQALKGFKTKGYTVK